MTPEEKKLACLRRMFERLDRQVRGAEALGQTYRGMDYHREERSAIGWAIELIEGSEWIEDGAPTDGAEETRR
jgi:hypothetical protein